MHAVGLFINPQHGLKPQSYAEPMTTKNR
jgi:hypothetical protein